MANGHSLATDWPSSSSRVHVLGVDIASIIRITTDADRLDRREHQDRIARYLAGPVDSEPDCPKLGCVAASSLTSSHAQSTLQHPRVRIKAATLHRLCFASDGTPFLSNLRFTGLAAAPESEVPHSSQLFWPLVIHIGLHNHFEGHM
jgi:hypothetical protein